MPISRTTRRNARLEGLQSKSSKGKEAQDAALEQQKTSHYFFCKIRVEGEDVADRSGAGAMVLPSESTWTLMPALIARAQETGLLLTPEWMILALPAALSCSVWRKKIFKKAVEN